MLQVIKYYLKKVSFGVIKMALVPCFIIVIINYFLFIFHNFLTVHYFLVVKDQFLKLLLKSLKNYFNPFIMAYYIFILKIEINYRKH